MARLYGPGLPGLAVLVPIGTKATITATARHLANTSPATCYTVIYPGQTPVEYHVLRPTPARYALTEKGRQTLEGDRA